MNKQEFIDMASELWLNLEVGECLHSVENIFLKEQHNVETRYLNGITEDINFVTSALRNLSPEANQFLDEVDKEGVVRHGRSIPIQELAKWLITLASDVEKQITTKKANQPQANHGEPQVPRSKIIGNPLFVNYYGLLKELNVIYEMARKIESQHTRARHQYDLIKITFHTMGHQNSKSLIEFLSMLEASVKFLCDHYNTEYEPVQIFSIETGSLELLIVLPHILSMAMEGVQGAANLAGIVFTVLEKYNNFKVSIEKKEQARLVTLIQEQKLKESTAKAEQAMLINSLLKGGAIHVIDLGRPRNAIDDGDMAQALNLITYLAPEDLAKEAKPAMKLLFQSEKPDPLALPPGSEEQNN